MMGGGELSVPGILFFLRNANKTQRHTTNTTTSRGVTVTDTVTEKKKKKKEKKKKKNYGRLRDYDQT